MAGTSDVTNQLKAMSLTARPRRDAAPTKTSATEATRRQVWGPFYVMHAPFRAKLSPPYALGDVVVVSGHVYALDTKEVLPFATIDLWQADPDVQEYDYYEDGPERREYKEELNDVGKAKAYAYRARAITDEHGRYEFETKLPKPYFDPDDSTWRCPHIHYFVQHPNYEDAVTQIYFEGQEKNEIDRHIRKETTLPLVPCEHRGAKWSAATFDVVLAPKRSD